jgi:uncharacterized protein YijF (DUF1287 family)
MKARPTSAFLCALALLAVAAPAQARPYTLRPAPLRASPSASARVLDEADANESVTILETKGGWQHVRLGVDREGWLPAALVSNVWIKAWKKERKLFLLNGERVEATYRMGLAWQAPAGDKQRLGDMATPEGRFYIAAVEAVPKDDVSGARGLRVSYPNAEDARRGLAAGLIKRDVYLRIVRAVRAGQLPLQHTALGSVIDIHGGGSGRDWTLGCLALDDADVVALFDRVGKGTRVEVYASAADETRLNEPNYLAAAVLAGAQAQLQAPAIYTHEAMRGATLSFPGGDIDPGQAVCSDIVVRALRSAGIDLQALIYEDRLLHPRRYGRRGEVPNPSLDHRRVRNIVPYLRAHAAIGAIGPAGELQPGDIVVLDTGIVNGTPYDHIGIVDTKRDPAGNPQLINLWTVGYRTQSMSLLGKSYPTVVAWFRLGHPFDYE